MLKDNAHKTNISIKSHRNSWFNVHINSICQDSQLLFAVFTFNEQKSKHKLQIIIFKKLYILKKTHKETTYEQSKIVSEWRSKQMVSHSMPKAKQAPKVAFLL